MLILQSIFSAEKRAYQMIIKFSSCPASKKQQENNTVAICMDYFGYPNTILCLCPFLEMISLKNIFKSVFFLML